MVKKKKDMIDTVKDLEKRVEMLEATLIAESCTKTDITSVAKEFARIKDRIERLEKVAERMGVYIP